MMTQYFRNGMTSAQVKRFYSNFAKEAHVKFVQKSWLEWLLKLAGNRLPAPVGDVAEKILDNVRPCALKNIVLLNHRIGDNTSWEHQVLVAVHEVGHCFRIRDNVDDGGTVTQWYRTYYVEGDTRATEEALAQLAEAAVSYFLFGSFPAFEIQGYYVLPEAARSAAKTYAAGCKEIKTLGRGGSTCEAAAIAIRCLRRIANS